MKEYAMKRLVALVACTCVMVQALMCSVMPTLHYDQNINKYANKILREIVTKDVDTELLILDSIPVQFQADFIQYTAKVPELRVNLLAMAKHESHNWKAMRSYRRNSNGTYDRGPLALNDANINDPIFMKKYAPPRYLFNNINNYYMVTCINYYIDLYKSYGINALYVYNGGLTRYNNGCISETTLDYYSTIQSNIKYYSNRLISIRITYIKNIIEERFNYKVSKIIYTRSSSAFNEFRQLKRVGISHAFIIEKKIKLNLPNFKITVNIKNTTDVFEHLDSDTIKEGSLV
jgi:hypothetical protein